MGATGPVGAQGPIGATGAQGPAGPTGPAGSGKYNVKINGTLSTALARPLYPVSTSGTNGGVTFITPQSYLVAIDAGGTVSGSGTATYMSGDCSGPALVANTTVKPGGVLALGSQNILYYVPRTGATTQTDPTPGSRSNNSSACAAFTTQQTGTFYVAPLNVPATTGVDPLAEPIDVRIDYVP